jgi:hypothetical protein
VLASLTAFSAAPRSLRARNALCAQMWLSRCGAFTSGGARLEWSCVVLRRGLLDAWLSDLQDDLLAMCGYVDERYVLMSVLRGSIAYVDYSETECIQLFCSEFNKFLKLRLWFMGRQSLDPGPMKAQSRGDEASKQGRPSINSGPPTSQFRFNDASVQVHYVSQLQP